MPTNIVPQKLLQLSLTRVLENAGIWVFFGSGTSWNTTPKCLYNPYKLLQRLMVMFCKLCRKVWFSRTHKTELVIVSRSVIDSRTVAKSQLDLLPQYVGGDRYIELVSIKTCCVLQPNCSLYLHLQVDPLLHPIPMPLSDVNAPGIILAQGSPVQMILMFHGLVFKDMTALD